MERFLAVPLVKEMQMKTTMWSGNSAGMKMTETKHWQGCWHPHLLWVGIQ